MGYGPLPNSSQILLTPGSLVCSLTCLISLPGKWQGNKLDFRRLSPFILENNDIAAWRPKGSKLVHLSCLNRGQFQRAQSTPSPPLLLGTSVLLILNQHLINSWLIHTLLTMADSWLSVDPLIYIIWKLVDSQPTADQDVDQVLIECQASVNRGVDGFSIEYQLTVN